MKKKFQFRLPSALVIVYLFLLLVALLTWFIPVSTVVEDAEGVSRVLYNTAIDEEGNLIENAGTRPAGLWDVILAPVSGFVDAASVSFTIFASGAFLAVLNFTGALDAAIGRLVSRFTGRVLIALLTLTFALMGTVYGSWEELPAYALIIIPLFVMAGYDVMTGIGVIFVGSGVGNMASIVNPFSTGAAVAAIGNPELSLGSGLLLRTVIFITLYALGTFLLIRYADRVKADKSASVVADLPDIHTLTDKKDAAQAPEFTPRRKWSMAVFFVMVLLIIMGYIPWYSIPVGDQTMYEVINYPLTALSRVPFLGHLLGVASFTPFGDWYFDELSVVFLAGSIIVAFINHMSEADFVREFIRGCEELMGVVLVLAVARGIALLMGTRTFGMSITFIYWIQSLLSGVPAWAFAIACVLAYTLIGIFLQSTSGVSGITMPILGTVAMALFAGTAVGEVGGQLMLISAFTLGLNFLSVLYPGATVMGIIELANVPYNRYLKFLLRFYIPILILGTALISVAPYIGLA